MRVELFYWDGCPSYPEAEKVLGDVLRSRGLDDQIVRLEVKTQEEAEALRFPGSPTIRIDSRDIDPSGADGPPALSCRIYHLPDGRVSPVPSRESLERALT